MIYRYAIAEDVPAYEMLGWMVVSYYGNRGGNECFLLAFPCACEAKEPKILCLDDDRESWVG